MGLLTSSTLARSPVPSEFRFLTWDAGMVVPALEFGGHTGTVMGRWRSPLPHRVMVPSLALL